VKRTIRHPDGCIEEQDGTPAELAEFDRIGHRDVKPPNITITPATPAPRQPLFPDSGASWPQSTGGPCLFENLPPGVYGIACPCPLHAVWCSASTTSST
jgi:hypothetical protein